MGNTVNGSNALPSAFKVTLDEDGRFYPRRFGVRRRASNGKFISFTTESAAIAYCWEEQRDWERMYPAPSDTRRSLVDVNDLGEVEVHLRDSGDI